MTGLKGHAVGGAGVAAAATMATTSDMQTGWRVFWLCFAGIGIVAEIVALRLNRPGLSASSTVWWLRGPVNGWRAFAVLAIMVWATFHFAFGWWA